MPEPEARGAESWNARAEFCGVAARGMLLSASVNDIESGFWTIDALDRPGEPLGAVFMLSTGDQALLDLLAEHLEAFCLAAGLGDESEPETCDGPQLTIDL